MSLFNDLFSFVVLIITAIVVGAILFVAQKRYENVLSYFGGRLALDRLAPTEIYLRRKIKTFFFLSAIFFLFIALAGPQWGIETVKDEAKTAQAVIAVDVSYSMITKDIAPSRLESAKQMFISLIRQLQDYRLGVIAFSGEAMVQCPVTTDTEALRYFVSVMQAGMLHKQGTSMASAINLSAKVLERYPGKKALILLTDGEDKDPSALDTAISIANDAGIRIIAVGIGTKDGQVLPDPFSNDYVKGSDGKIVISRLDEASLTKIASQTQGAYIQYTNPDDVSNKVYRELMNLDKTSSENRERTVYKNRYQMPLALSLILLFAGMLIPERRLFGKKTAALFLALGLFLPYGQAAGINDKLREGADDYLSENYDNAIEKYTQAITINPADVRSYYNLGNSYYKNEEYDKAVKAYENLLQYSNPQRDAKLVQDTLYNMGNAYYKDQNVDKAVASYRSAILMNPTDGEAKNNLQIALEKQKSNCQNQNDDKKDEKDKKDDKKEQDKDKDKGQQGDKDKDDKGKSGDKQDKKDQDKNNKGGQGDKEKEDQQQQPQDKQPQNPNALDKSAAERLMQMAKDQERQNAPKGPEQNRQGMGGGLGRSEFDW